jgi:hypothetical protein
MHKAERGLLFYRPHSIDEAVLYHNPDLIPQRQFAEDQNVMWHAMLTPMMGIFVNFVHEDYPEAYCQVQMFPNPSGDIDTIFLHGGPERSHIPPELAEQILHAMMPDVMAYLAIPPSPLN